jgi:hypothetical protein
MAAVHGTLCTILLPNQYVLMKYGNEHLIAEYWPIVIINSDLIINIILN